MALITDMLSQAKLYATRKHVLEKGQLYAHTLPYTHHLSAVHHVLMRFDAARGVETPEDMQVAAWLHDVVEDTDAKLKDVEELFGEEVARLVGAVTNEEAPNRKMRHALTYPKIREAGPLAIRLKLADRIANVEAGGKLVGMYRKEHEDFKRMLKDGADNDDMWTHLDGLMS